MKTAVEIIREHFYTYAEPYNGFSEEPKWTISKEDFEKLIQQAKEMEKKIIAQAFEDGDYNYFYNHQNGREFENGLEYYNEKFKSE